MTHSVTDEVPQHRDNQGPSRPSTLAKTLHEERKRKLWTENMPSIPPVPICMISRLVYLFKTRSKPVRLDMKKKSDLKYRGIDILGSLSLVCCLPMTVIVISMFASIASLDGLYYICPPWYAPSRFGPTSGVCTHLNLRMADHSTSGLRKRTKKDNIQIMLNVIRD